MNEKTDATVDSIIATTDRQFGAGTVTQVGRAAPECAVIPTGYAGLDDALHVGGWPKGRVVEVFGPEYDDLTGVALRACREAQAANGIAMWVDTTHTFSVDVAKAAGISIPKLLISQPDTGEQAIEIAEVVARSGAVDLIVIDSANLVPRAVLEGETDDDFLLRARLVAQAMRTLTGIVFRVGCTILVVNHLPQNVNGPVLSVSPGTNALRFYASVRVEVRRGASADPLRAKVVKNKVAPPFGVADLV